MIIRQLLQPSPCVEHEVIYQPPTTTGVSGWMKRQLHFCHPMTRIKNQENDDNGPDVVVRRLHPTTLTHSKIDDDDPRILDRGF